MKPSSKKNKTSENILNKISDTLFVLANKINDIFSLKRILYFVSVTLTILILVEIYWIYDVSIQKTRTLKVKLISDNSNKEKLYEFVNIGTQKWMSKNLEVGHYRNGDPIPHVQDPNEWSKLKTGAWCYYENKKENGKQFGKLYNWYAVNDIRGLAPKGFHIPSEEEWSQLNDYLGEKAGYKLKTKSGWIENGNGSNESQFSAKSAGYRYADASRFAYGYTCWWSSDATIDVAYYRYVGFDIYELGKAFNYKGYGLSVRCIKDNDQ